MALRRLLDLTVNGAPRGVLIDTRQTLLDLLRDGLNLWGAKEGCGNGNCGACTVILDGVAVDSCLVLAAECAGRDVLTIEGLATGGLSSLQKAFVELGALECGFCTPGFIMSSRALLESNPNPTEAEIRLALAGNLCRCTGYDKIVRAVVRAAAVERGET